MRRSRWDAVWRWLRGWIDDRTRLDVDPMVPGFEERKARAIHHPTRSER